MYEGETVNVKFVTENDTEIEKFSWAALEDLNHDMAKRNSKNAGFNDYPDMNGAYSDSDGDEE